MNRCTTRWHLLAAAALILGIGGCSSSSGSANDANGAPSPEPGGGQRICTMIGCNSGLTVMLGGTPPAEYTVTVEEIGGSAAPRTVHCSASMPCAPGAFFSEYTPAAVRVTVRAGDRVKTEEFSPTYVTSRPNGEGCEPVCRQGKVTVAL